MMSSLLSVTRKITCSKGSRQEDYNPQRQSIMRLTFEKFWSDNTLCKLNSQFLAVVVYGQRSKECVMIQEIEIFIYVVSSKFLIACFALLEAVHFHCICIILSVLSCWISVENVFQWWSVFLNLFWLLLHTETFEWIGYCLGDMWRRCRGAD